jgi:hypothetical protein
MNAPYKTLRLGRSGKVALVDADDHARLCRFSWQIYSKRGRDYVNRVLPFKAGRVQLSHDVLNLAAHVRVCYANGDPLDCRKANLQPLYGNIAKIKGLRRTFRVAVGIDHVVYVVGYFSTRRDAEHVRQIAGETAAELRGRGLTRKQIQRRLDLATSDGAELSRLIRAVLPVDLTSDVRDEATQEIALAVLEGRITPDELSIHGAVRDYLRAAARLSRLGDRRHISLEHPISDGLRLVDVLAGSIEGVA